MVDVAPASSCEHCSEPAAEVWRFSIQAEVCEPGGTFRPVVNSDLADQPGGLLQLLHLCRECAYRFANHFEGPEVEADSAAA